MMNMTCVAHGYKVQQAEEIKANITDENNVKWLFERLIRLFNNIPTGLITTNALDALGNFTRSYRRDGLDGGLVHVSWVISSLHKLPRNSENQELLDAAEAVATALKLEW